jgi:hypothetical protein
MRRRDKNDSPLRYCVMQCHSTPTFQRCLLYPTWGQRVTMSLSDDGGSDHLRNAGPQRDYTTQYLRRPSFAYTWQWEPVISRDDIFDKCIIFLVINVSVSIFGLRSSNPIQSNLTHSCVVAVYCGLHTTQLWVRSWESVSIVMENEIWAFWGGAVINQNMVWPLKILSQVRSMVWYWIYMKFMH